MNYYNVNYESLKRIKVTKYFTFLVIVFLILIGLFLYLKKIQISSNYEVYGIYENDMLHVKIHNNLSDTLNKCKYVIFQNKKVKITNLNFYDYEFINEEIYQTVSFTLDKKFKQNEIGIVKIPMQEKSAFNYILELFK